MRSTNFFKTELATLVISINPSSAHNEDSNTSTGQYKLTDDLSYSNFFDGFNFVTEADPTEGFVQYQGLPSTISQGLVGYLNDTQSVVMSVDYKTSDPKGRASMHLESQKARKHGLLIADILHMPSSQCGPGPPSGCSVPTTLAKWSTSHLSAKSSSSKAYTTTNPTPSRYAPPMAASSPTAPSPPGRDRAVRWRERPVLGLRRQRVRLRRAVQEPEAYFQHDVLWAVGGQGVEKVVQGEHGDCDV